MSGKAGSRRVSEWHTYLSACAAVVSIRLHTPSSTILHLPLARVSTVGCLIEGIIAADNSHQSLRKLLEFCAQPDIRSAEETTLQCGIIERHTSMVGPITKYTGKTPGQIADGKLRHSSGRARSVGCHWTRSAPKSWKSFTRAETYICSRYIYGGIRVTAMASCQPAKTSLMASFCPLNQDLEKLAPKKGVISQSVKEVLQVGYSSSSNTLLFTTQGTGLKS